jgi:hypothetical protein
MKDGVIEKYDWVYEGNRTKRQLYLHQKGDFETKGK